MSELDNRWRWSGAPGAYEVWYLTWNHAPTKTGYWLRYTLEAPTTPGHAPYAALWFARFDTKNPQRTFGIHRRYPMPTPPRDDAPFAIHFGSARLTDDTAIGALAGDGHELAWNLHWTGDGPTLHHLPGTMYRRGGLGDTTVLSPNPRVALSGTLTVDGESIALHDVIAGQTHVWGKKHAHAWAWARCAQFDDDRDAVFEGLSVKLRRAGVTLPTLTVATLRLDGETHDFRHFRHTLVNRGEWSAGAYRFRTLGGNVRLDGAFTCARDELLLTPYEDPDGEASYCANTEVGDVRLDVSRLVRGRWRDATTLTSRGCGHFETGSREDDLTIPHRHALVS